MVNHQRYRQQQQRYEVQNIFICLFLIMIQLYMIFSFGKMINEIDKEILAKISEYNSQLICPDNSSYPLWMN